MKLNLSISWSISIITSRVLSYTDWYDQHFFYVIHPLCISFIYNDAKKLRTIDFRISYWIEILPIIYLEVK